MVKAVALNPPVGWLELLLQRTDQYTLNKILLNERVYTQDRNGCHHHGSHGQRLGGHGLHCAHSALRGSVHILHLLHHDIGIEYLLELRLDWQQIRIGYINAGSEPVIPVVYSRKQRQRRNDRT